MKIEKNATWRGGSPLDSLVRLLTMAIEYAVVFGLLFFAADVFVHSFRYFVSYGRGSYPMAVVNGIDGMMIVIIALDIAHTVFGYLRSAVFPVRPFLAIGILAGIRDILSASARLTLGGRLTNRAFENTMISLLGGVAVVIVLIVALWILRRDDAGDDTATA